jgi:uncharacterized membrane protein YheB (UPF0754 family)
MFDYRYLSTPLIGTIIGYFTNALAIKMLFRPYAEKRIGRFRLPFTPGLIPKNRGRLAAAIGEVVGRELLNGDVVKRALLSEAMRQKLDALADEWFDECLRDERPMREALSGVVGERHFSNLEGLAREQVSAVLAEKIREADVGGLVAGSVMKSIGTKTPAPMHKILHPVLTDKRREDIQRPLRDSINRYVSANADALVGAMIAAQMDKALDAPVSDAARRALDQKARAKRALFAAFERLVSTGAERALKEIDLAGIVEAQISGFDSRQIEKVVFSVMNKELRAIIWLGALLGFIMGLCNLLFL